MGWEVTLNCKACNKEHSVYWAGQVMPDMNKMFTAECPGTHKKLAFAAGIGIWMSSEAKPEGSIEVAEYQPHKQ